MHDYQIVALIISIFYLAVFVAGVYLLVLLIKALKHFISSKEVREEKRIIIKSLSEVLRENRTRCTMTQEFVAETLGVSRQAVSKWENGTSEPSTSNLLALAKLYGISAEELLRGIDDASQKEGGK